MENLSENKAPRYRLRRFCQATFRLFALLVLSASVANTKGHAQKQTENKYVIQLPEEWNGKSKLLLKIIYVIDTHIPELDTKELCLSCNADYKVEFKISNSHVKQAYFNQYGTIAYTVLYQFFAYMNVSEKSGRIIHRLVLTDTNEAHGYKVSRISYGAALSTDMFNELRNRLPTDIASTIASTRLQQAVDDEKMKAAMAPDQKELWAKVEKIIMKFKFVDE